MKLKIDSPSFIHFACKNYCINSLGELGSWEYWKLVWDG